MCCVYELCVRSEVTWPSVAAAAAAVIRRSVSCWLLVCSALQLQSVALSAAWRVWGSYTQALPLERLQYEALGHQYGVGSVGPFVHCQRMLRVAGRSVGCVVGDCY